MTITKFGHSCFLVEEAGARILADPGKYSDGRQNGLLNLDAILITHEHADHCDVDSIAALQAKNPNVRIYTNASVGAVLESANIPWTLLEAKQTIEIAGLTVEGVAAPHAAIHPSRPVVENLGFFIANRLFHPGDSLSVPSQPVEILMAPIVAPWSKFSEVADYLVAVQPKTVIPVHDGFLRVEWPATGLIPGILEPFGGQMMLLEIGQPTEL